MYRVGRNDKNSIRKIQIVPKMLAQIGIPLGVVHRSGRSHNPEKTRRDLFRMPSPVRICGRNKTTAPEAPANRKNIAT